MKNKKLLSLLLYILAPLMSIILIGASKSYQSKKTCTKVNISIEYKGENFFLDVFSVRKLIGADELILGASIEEIQLTKIEQTLLATNYVSKVNAFVNFDGVLSIQIWLKNPIARIMNADGQSFYLNEQKQKIPISETFTARTLLVRGNFKEDFIANDTIKDSLLIKNLPLIESISNNEFWSAYLSEIYMDTRGNITLYPSIGDLYIKFGKIQDYDKKLKSLEAFLINVAPKTGWNKYKCLNLEFKNQIVAQRK